MPIVSMVLVVLAMCGKKSYGLRMNNAYIWNHLEEKYGDKVQLMPEDTDWLSDELDN